MEKTIKECELLPTTMNIANAFRRVLPTMRGGNDVTWGMLISISNPMHQVTPHTTNYMLLRNHIHGNIKVQGLA